MNSEGHKSADIYRLINKGQLSSAFSALRARIPHSSWQLIELLDRQEETYKYMVHYMFEGGSDPKRGEMYNSIKQHLYMLTDASDREIKVKDDPKEYFSKLRIKRMHPASLRNLLDAYESEKDLSSRENISNDIFTHIWLSFPLSQDEIDQIERFYNLPDVETGVKALIIAALMLALIEYYDEEKLILLLKIYLESTVDLLSSRAIVSVIIALIKHNERIEANSRIRQILETIADDPKRIKDVICVIKNLIQTQDTDRINSKIQEEVIPEIMKLRPEIMRRFRTDSRDMDMSMFEENPEWEDIIKRSGLTDKIKALTDMQIDGGDVMMMAFSNLKGFPFFNLPQNWFLPFSVHRCELKGLTMLTENGSLSKILSMDGIICDSDKYSFAFAICQMPEQQKELMLSQMQTQFENLSDDKETSLSKSLSANKTLYISSFVKDLFRFFRLYKKKNDYDNIFADPLNLLEIPVFGNYVATTEELDIFAEFYFSRGYYKQAIPLFEKVIERENVSEQAYQKLGYAYQSTKKIDKAIENYQKAEIINPDSLWLIKKLAVCHKALGDFSEAKKYYERITILEPENLRAVINLGHCYLESNDISSALNCYYKADYFDSSSDRTWRPIAWCEFLAGNYSKSRNYYEKLIVASNSPQDYMNMGHLAFVEKKLKEALKLYKLSVKYRDGNIDSFINDFNNDRNILLSHGVDPVEIDIVSDRISYDN